MPAPLILGALGLAARLAPDIVGLFAGNDSRAAKAARVAGDVARTLTGQDDEEGAVEALRADPQLLAEFEREMRRFALRELELENERLATVNKTIRAEAQSSDAYVRRWRPTFGYIVSLTWAAMFAGATWAMVASPADAAAIIEAITALTPMWGIALAVLGVNVVKRSEDKRVAAGAAPPAGMVEQVRSLIRGERDP